jgi:hypothetical protein
MVPSARRDLIGAGLLLAVILAALWVSGSIDVAQFGVNERLSGPRGYPRALLLVGLALAVALVVVTLRRARRHRDADAHDGDVSISEPARPLALLAGLVVFSLALETAGYLIAMSLLLVYGARIYGARSWWQTLAAASGFTLASIVLFRYGLDTVLPEGWLGIDAVLGS